MQAQKWRLASAPDNKRQQKAVELIIENDDIILTPLEAG
jgi:hypothetical protein